MMSLHGEDNAFVPNNEMLQWSKWQVYVKVPKDSSIKAGKGFLYTAKTTKFVCTLAVDKIIFITILLKRKKMELLIGRIAEKKILSETLASPSSELLTVLAE